MYRPVGLDLKVMRSFVMVSTILTFFSNATYRQLPCTSQKWHHLDGEVHSIQVSNSS